MRTMLSVLGVVAVSMSAARAQAPPSTTRSTGGLVVGSGNFFSPIVRDLGKAVAFYRDGLGLDAAGDASDAANNEPLRHMFGLPDAQIRWMIARPPAMRTGVEIIEITKVPSRPVERRIQDPGAVTLVLEVRDIDASLARLTQIGASIVTRGGAPVRIGPGATRALLAKDPDGHFVELIQPDPLPATSAANVANILGVRVRLTVDDVERTLRLYRDTLGLQQTALDSVATDRATPNVFGLTGARYRLAATQVPTSNLVVEFIEFAGIDRRSVRAAIQDPGSTRMQLQVRDVDAAIAALKSAGGAVVSTGGQTVGLPGRGGATTKVAIVREPSNLFLVLIQATGR
jgi:predicted enzyme related to lactoylglutathione lyase